MNGRDYTAALPRLTEAEFAALRDDIAERGVLVPVELDGAGNLLDGAHRMRACEELGIEPPTITRRGLSEQEKQAHALTLNLTRRQLTREDRRKLHRELRRLGKSLREIAEASGDSKDTVRRDVEGVAGATPEHVTGRDGKTYPASKPAPILNVPGAVVATSGDADEMIEAKVEKLKRDARGRGVDPRFIEMEARIVRADETVKSCARGLLEWAEEVANTLPTVAAAARRWAYLLLADPAPWELAEVKAEAHSEFVNAISEAEAES